MEKKLTFELLVNEVVGFINVLIPAIFALVFVYLMWRVIDSWVLHAGEDGKREEGKQYVIAAVIAFVVMVSAWGIIALIRNFVFA